MVVEFPVVMGFGSAVMLTDVGCTTVTVVLSVFVPELFIAVMVYVVVTLGETLVDPFRPTVPIPPSMLTDVALDVTHASVEEPSAPMVSGVDNILTLGRAVLIDISSMKTSTHSSVALDVLL